MLEKGKDMDCAGTDRHFQALASTLRWEAFSGVQQKSDMSSFHGRDDSGFVLRMAQIGQEQKQREHQKVIF